MTSRRIVPGPGAYDQQNMSLTGISFARDKRAKLRETGVPGPGTYKIPVTFANVPTYLIPGRDESVRFI